VSQDPGSWVDRMIGWCFGILLGVIALYCTVRLIESILPTLIVIIGIVALIAAIIGLIVVFQHGEIGGEFRPFDPY
jgi:heme/copper-type cytochrome/quinol oxidase subunit 4